MCTKSNWKKDHSMQARKSAGKISTLDLKPMRKDTRSPKQEQSVAPQNGPWSRQKIFKKKKKIGKSRMFKCRNNNPCLNNEAAHKGRFTHKAIIKKNKVTPEWVATPILEQLYLLPLFSMRTVSLVIATLTLH